MKTVFSCRINASFFLSLQMGEAAILVKRILVSLQGRVRYVRRVSRTTSVAMLEAKT